MSAWTGIKARPVALMQTLSGLVAIWSGPTRAVGSSRCTRAGLEVKLKGQIRRDWELAIAFAAKEAFVFCVLVMKLVAIE